MFADLGFADSVERKLRVQLTMQVNEAIQRRGVSQALAARLLGISQPHVSDLAHYKLSRFSSERLLHFITRSERDVEIVIRPKVRSRSFGTLTVHSVS